ncbi:MAG: hypothetical protein U0353_08730 [Sandaracinus sp.]
MLDRLGSRILALATRMLLVVLLVASPSLLPAGEGRSSGEVLLAIAGRTRSAYAQRRVESVPVYSPTTPVSVEVLPLAGRPADLRVLVRELALRIHESYRYEVGQDLAVRVLVSIRTDGRVSVVWLAPAPDRDRAPPIASVVLQATQGARLPRGRARTCELAIALRVDGAASLATLDDAALASRIPAVSQGDAPLWVEGRLGQVSSPEVQVDPQHRAILERTVRQHANMFGGCYQEALQVRGPLVGQGTFELRLLIDDGIVVTAEAISDPTGSPQFFDCVQSSARTWAFPGGSVSGPVVVRMTLRHREDTRPFVSRQI